MRILHVMQCANLGGMEQTTLLRIEGLVRRGHACRLVSLNPVGGLGPLLDARRIPFDGLPYKGMWGWRSGNLMYHAFRSEPTDAVMMTGHNLAAMLALGQYGRRRLLCIHFCHTGVKPAWQWRIIYRLALRQFHVVTYATDFIRREAEEIYPPIAAICHTLRNPFVVPELPTEEERLLARKRFGIPREARVVGSAGWLIEGKRLDVFLRVAREVVAAVPQAVFAVAGDGPLRSALVEQAKGFGIADRVQWLGWQQDLRPFYCLLDALHFNSDWDALGRTPLEALALGVPVVASVTHGGLSEVLQNGVHGFLTSTHDIDWLTEKVLFLLGNAEQGQRMVRAAREHLTENCSPECDLDSIIRFLLPQ